MGFSLRAHYDNASSFQNPHLWVWYDDSDASEDFAPTGSDTFGFVYEIEVKRNGFQFKFKDGLGTVGPWEDHSLERSYRPSRGDTTTSLGNIWCKGDKAFVYLAEPRAPEAVSAQTFLRQLPVKPGVYIPDTGGLSGLGANVLADGRILFGFYHPNAARVYLVGSFNNWQCPGHDHPDPIQFIELKLYQGYFGLPNLWLVVNDQAKVGDEYKFFVQGGVPKSNHTRLAHFLWVWSRGNPLWLPGGGRPRGTAPTQARRGVYESFVFQFSDEQWRFQQYCTDPYARQVSADHGFNNAVIVDPTSFIWHDDGWTTPDISQLILYELSVYGFTEGDPDIAPANRGKFKGITERIHVGYFDQLGVTALSLMPLAEVPSPQGPQSLGYDPSLFFAVERDFGSPDDLRELVDTAHRKGLAVLLDQVFNHTSNGFNPLWKMILEHPREEGNTQEGGLYFNGTTPWGNRITTEKIDVQNMLIDACKLFIAEYHVAGFCFDATHTNYMDHGFLERLAKELKAFKSNIVLVVENLPNQADLNRQGYDGYAQWCDPFHDKMKALLREDSFEGEDYTTDNLGDIFYFSKQHFAGHTNNVVNYSESHDETSIPYEVATNDTLNTPAAKDRKGRLGLLSTVVALGQPMLYMGQEFNVERGRNYVSFSWPSSLTDHGFYQWVSRLTQLRRRYPGLKLYGDNPADAGQFAWIIAPWLAGNRGGGRKVLGWRVRPTPFAHDTLVVLLNFDNHDVQVDIDFGLPGVWVKLADIEQVNDIPPNGTNSAQTETAALTNDGNFGGFTLPRSSGFIYKWEAP